MRAARVAVFNWDLKDLFQMCDDRPIQGGRFGESLETHQGTIDVPMELVGAPVVAMPIAVVASEAAETVPKPLQSVREDAAGPAGRDHVVVYLVVSRAIIFLVSQCAPLGPLITVGAWLKPEFKEELIDTCLLAGDR